MSRFLFGLLCISVWINYMDRGNLSVVAPALRPEMHLSPTQMGVLLSGFFWTYSLLQPVAGWLVDRYDVYRVYALAFAVWSLAVAAGGSAWSFESLLLSRLALGAGESLAYPSYSRMLAERFKEEKRGLANAMIDAGTKAGPALGTFLGAIVTARWGWRWFFWGMGLASLLWLLPWLRAIPAPTIRQPRDSQKPAAHILRRRDAWVTFFGLFCFNYAFYFLLTWLPSYLVEERKFSMSTMAVYAALPFCATAVASLATGALSDRIIRRGSPAIRVRQRIAVAGLLLCSAMLWVSSLVGNAAAMVCLVTAFVGIGMFTANVWAITQTLAGSESAGAWTGWQNAVGNMGGVIAPILTGWSVAVRGSFLTAFAVASVMLLIAALLYGPGLRSNRA